MLGEPRPGPCQGRAQRVAAHAAGAPGRAAPERPHPRPDRGRVMGRANATTFPRPHGAPPPHNRGVGEHPAPSFHKQASSNTAGREKEVTPMFRALRKHLTPSTFIAFLALVFAVTGGAFAASGPGGGGSAKATASSTRTGSAGSLSPRPPRASPSRRAKAGPRGPAGPKGATGCAYRPRGSYRSSGSHGRRCRR